jgi:exodeoxyribonuclease V gamma subunit
MTFASPFSLPPGFMVVHGNRLEDLRDLAVDFVQRHPLPPLQSEVFLVQSNGMKHWLELALAEDTALGICAATRMELPSAFLWQMYRTVLGAQAVPVQMPFDKSALVWRLQRMLPALAENQEVYAPLARYLASDTDRRKLYQLAQQVADVLDGYQSYRADWLTDWSAGRDVLQAPQAAATPLPEDQAWQAHLWRAVQSDVGVAHAQASRSAVHARFMQALSDRNGQGRPAGVPHRVVVFGISTLPMQAVEALAALGRYAQVLMVVQNPCQHYWGHVVEGRGLMHARTRQKTKTGVPVHTLPDDLAALHPEAHPLLASWGKQGRDYLHLLDGYDQPETYAQVLQKIEVFVPPQAAAGQSLNQLQHLQTDILNLEPLPATPSAMPTDDGAITLVTTHSAQREVEVLHDQVLAWLDADPALQPRDVMVMVPDMAQFVPHIQAVFGRFSPSDARYLPYLVADSTSREMPLVQALERLLGLPTSRISLADWLSLFEVAAVQKRYGFSPADVRVLQNWLTRAGVRWGLDVAHRKTWGVPAIDGADQNTWAFGLRRLLLGYASGPGSVWQGVEPLPEVGGLSAQLIGRLAEWVQAMNASLAALSQAHTPGQWVTTLQALLARFFEASDEAEERLLAQLQRELQRWLQLCHQADLTTPLPLVVVREHWLAQIESPGLHQRFLGGGVQFATLMPMRSIPFKVVCLLGMNDKDYPRQTPPRDFDLMALQWRGGDRSRREDDRYLFLEALLSAREKLYISWQGHRATDNAEQPPSVLVSQLIDVLQARFAQAPEVVLQPLQAFSSRYFEEGSRFKTYAADWQLAMDAALDGRIAHLPTDEAFAPTSATVPTSLDLETLQKFLRHPVEVYWRTRLGVWIAQPEEAAPEEEPFELDGLAQFKLGQTLLQADNAEQALQVLQRAGELPMAAFGQRIGHDLLHKAQAVRERAEPLLAQYPQLLLPQAVDLQVAGVQITGALRDLRQSASGRWQLAMQPGAITHGKDNAHPRLDKWINVWVVHVVACAMGHSLQSTLLGIDGESHLPALPQEQALAQLTSWVQAYKQAWLGPLPVAMRTALAYLETLSMVSEADEDTGCTGDSATENALDKAREAFDGTHQREGEWAHSAYLQRSFESFDDVALDLPGWAEALYGGLMGRVRLGTFEAESVSGQGVGA